MKKHLLPILLMFIVLFSCEKEKEANLKKTSPPVNSVKDTSDTTSVSDTSEFVVVKDTLYWGVYKGVIVSGKEFSGLVSINILSDTSGTCFLKINENNYTLEFLNNQQTRNKYIVKYINPEVQVSITTSKDGLNPIVTIDYRNIDFMSYVLKESLENSVSLYEGEWIATVKTPLNTFEEKGLWSIAHNNSTIIGSNGEGPINGSISLSGVYSGTHNNGTFTGSKNDSGLTGTFKWSAFGLNGTGNWNATEFLFVE